MIGGTNFTIHYYLLKGRFKFAKDPEFLTYLSIIAIATVILTLYNLKIFNPFDSFRFSFFQVVSIMTTTGYTTYDFDTWCDGVKMILLILMFIGGCSGSTGGGMKVIRIYILLKYAVVQIFKSAEPKTVKAIRYGMNTIKREVVESVVAFFILYIMIFTISTLILTLSGYDLLTSTSAVVACLSNVGPGMGLAGASETYSFFPDYIKILLALNMWIGRLEIYTVLALFIPSFWRERW
jgi:trk system potassium uptake protein TrkH